MSVLKKRRFIYSSLMFFVLSISSYVGLSYFGSHENSAHAQGAAGNNLEKVIIKIPPPIEGVKETIPVAHPQKLQVSDIQVLTSQEKTLVFRVELARALDEHRMGMMFRSNVPPGTGMLFIFDDVKERAFWMKNTWEPLDIIFIRKDGVIHHIYHNAVPGSLEHIKSEGAVQHVLEIGGGEAKRRGVTVGDRVIYD